MTVHKLLLLPGDGIGPEVMAEVEKLMAWMNGHGLGRFETETGPVGGACYDAYGLAVTEATMALACSPICGRRFPMRRLPMHRASSARSSKGSTS